MERSKDIPPDNKPPFGRQHSAVRFERASSEVEMGVENAFSTAVLDTLEPNGNGRVWN